MEQIVRRKPLFDAVRIILGRGLWQSEVEMLDRAIDRALAGDTASAVEASRRLGALSARFESGGRGPGAVSSGQGDPGGVSYGIYQLASKTGTAAAFVKAEGARWRCDFAEAQPGSEAFTSAWKAIAGREPEAFAEAQHAFIERTHYRPAVASVLQDTGLDLDARHQAVRDATWSVAVQHGRAARVLAGAVAKVDAVLGRQGVEFDRHLIEAIYAERTDYVLRLAARSKGAARATLEAISRNRFPAELARARAMLEDETSRG